MQKKEFEITLKVKVEATSLDTARTIANGIVEDLKRCGEYYVDRPINHVRWNRITPCGPFAPIVVNESGRELADAVDAAVAAVDVAMEESDAIDYRDQPNDVDLVDPVAFASSENQRGRHYGERQRGKRS